MSRAAFHSILTLGAGLVLACGARPSAVDSSLPDPPPGAADPAAAESTWITSYDPQRAWNGYTLVFEAQRTPMLLDMNGRIVHRWQDARVKSRLWLLPDGSLLGIALGRGVVEYNWDGSLLWEYTPDNGFVHHDVRRLANGNTLLLVLPDDSPFDEILEVDRSGSVVWRWRSEQHLAHFAPERRESDKDLTHMNSVQELPANRWFDAGDARFRPGNLLVSARDLDRIFVVDKQTGEITWSFDHELQKQHEALMVAAGEPGAGAIQLFNNRIRSFYRDRRSTVLAIDPVADRIVWQYRTPSFFSPTGGVQQSLPNGNVLITSTRGGRTFEVTRGGRLVWEWVPPFDPVRSQRYSYDHCPQLDALARLPEIPVHRDDSRRHVDKDVYRFARQGLLREIRVDGVKRSGILEHPNDCRQMTLPFAPTVQLEYGIAKERARAAGLREAAATFRLRIRPAGSDESVVVLEERLDLEGPSWREHRLELAPWALQPVDFCLETELTGIPPGRRSTPEIALWRRPAIRSGVERAPAVVDSSPEPDDLTPEELETRRKHLEALGYIN